MPAEYAKEPVNMSKEKWEYEQSFKDYILDNARLCLSYAGSLEHFIFLMKRMGYEFKGRDYLSVRIPGMKLYHRLDKLDTIFSKEELPTILKYGYGQYYRRYNTKSVLYVKRANLTPLQKKYYAKMYRLGLIEKKCYQYRSADMAKPICVYSVTGKNRVNDTGEETFGLLCFAEITEFAQELHSEMEKVVIMDELPENWTYPLIQPKLIEKYSQIKK